MRTVSPVDAAWLVLESRDTPMHVGGLFEFTLPPNAPADYLKKEFDRWRAPQTIPPPWNLRLVEGPLLGPRLPLMREVRDVDLDYHIRHSALPHPGGQRELGVLVSRLHSHQLDLHRPLWEVHLIEGLEGNRFALYSKTHHSLIDGVSGMRLIMRALSADSDRRGMAPFWAVGEGARRQRAPEQNGNPDGLLRKPLSLLRESASSLVGLSRASADLALAALDERPLQAPYRAPDSVLGGHLTGQRRFATQQYELDKIKALARVGECTVNDVVLYLSGSALRRYLQEHARIPERTLTAGIPVNLREADDQSMGTAVGMIVAELGTFNLGISNVPGPTEPLYLNGSRLDALFPLSLLLHGNALNITCVSYAGTLNFGFTGARDNLPHLQRLAIYMGESLTEIERVLLKRRGARSAGRSASSNAGKGASKNARTVAG